MITQSQIDQVNEFTLLQSSISDNTVIQLRSQHPQIHFTYCMDDDVQVGYPVIENRSFNLYLIDSSNHCLSFTRDMELATGIVIAEIEQE